MKVSVVIPTYNRKDTLALTIESLQRQTYDPDLYEIIVVDDGSRDGTREVIRDRFKNVLYCRQENKGPASARNKGIKIASGEIVAFTDDDCDTPPNWIESLVNGFKKYPEAACAGGYQRATDEVLAGNIYAGYEYYLSRNEHGTKEEEMLGGFECPAGGTNNLAVRKEIFETVGLFDESFPCAAGEDADFKYRACRAGYKFLYLPVYVVHNQPYTFKSFTRQSITRGKGVRYYQKKHGGLKPRAGYALKVFTIPMLFLRTLLTKGVSFALIHTCAEVCYTMGKIKVR